MASKQITVGIGIPMIVTGFFIAVFWAPLVGDVKETVEFIGSLIGIIAVSYTHLTLPTIYSV